MKNIWEEFLESENNSYQHLSSKMWPPIPHIRRWDLCDLILNLGRLVTALTDSSRSDAVWLLRPRQERSYSFCLDLWDSCSGRSQPSPKITILEWPRVVALVNSWQSCEWATWTPAQSSFQMTPVPVNMWLQPCNRHQVKTAPPSPSWISDP